METIEDILNGMRSTYATLSKMSYYKHDPLLSSWNGYIVRIETAYKRLESDRDNWRKQALEEDAANQIKFSCLTNDLDAEVAKLLAS